MLNRDQISVYHLKILAFDGHFKALTKLTINVLNVNDKRPQCPNSRIDISLVEDFPTGLTFFMANALSPENPSNFNYKLATVTTKFKLHPTHGSLQLIEPLDYETQQSYTLLVNVFNSLEERPITWQDFCTIQLNIHVTDVNDNLPKFRATPQQISITENSQTGTIITQLEATDADSFLNRRFKFSLINETRFSIDSISGLITLISPHLDRELISDWVNLTVRATDLFGLFTETQLPINILDQNDNRPLFPQTSIFVSVQENLPIGFVVTRLEALDPDLNPDIKYYLIPSNHSSKFSINETTGEVILKESLNYEATKSFTIRIGVFDTQLPKSTNNNSICQLNIDVLDLNDNRPVFNTTSSIEVQIDENSPFNTTVFTLQAYDSDQTNRLEYRLIDGNQLNKFGVDLHSGRVFAKSSLDYEQLDERVFRLVVECSDGIHHERQSINVNIRDLNDNAPEFSRKNETIIFRDTLEVNKVVTHFDVTDPDFSDQLRFVLVDQSEENSKFKIQPVFSVHSNGSLILLRKVRGGEAYIIRVRCYDEGKPNPLYGETYLYVRVADGSSHEPELMGMDVRIVTLGEAGIHEAAAAAFVRIEAGDVVAGLVANDPDPGDKLIYRLQRPDNEMFSVNEKTGDLKSSGVLLETAKFELRPLVTDKKFVTESQLTLRVKNVDTECLTNSVYIRLKSWRSDSLGPVSLNDFVYLDYLKRLKEIISRILSSNKKKYSLDNGVPEAKYEISSIEIVGLRNSTSDAVATLQTPSLIEVLFVVRQTPTKICVNSKLISKLLNRRKSVITKRMQLHNSAIQFNIDDISYNTECFGNPSHLTVQLTSICSINKALHNCYLRFNGYNSPSLCESDQSRHKLCYLIPKYTWLCDDTLNHNTQLPDTKTNKPKTYIITDYDKEEASDNNLEETNQLETDELESKTEANLSCRRPHNPCQNNAICRIVKIASLKAATFKSRIHCFCPNGFRGRYCAEDIDECADVVSSSSSQQQTVTSPCTSQATCVNTHGSYYCNCTSQPASLCYNQLSPQYSASRTEQQYKYYGRTGNDDLILTDDGIVEYANDKEIDGRPDDEKDNLLFGLISPRTLRQGLLGFFGGICGLLVILSLAAGFICQMNLTQNRMYISQDFRLDENTETPLNTDSLAECLSNGDTNNNGNHSTCDDADPTSSCVSISSSSASSGQHRRLKERISKNRTSMTMSLLSSHADESDETSGKRRRHKYSINNLLFAKLRCENKIEKSVSDFVVKEQIEEEMPLELFDLIKESENDADDEAVKPIKLLAELKNDMSSFSRKKSAGQVAVNPMFKFNTMRSGMSAELKEQEKTNTIGHHTISGRSGSRGCVGFIRAPVQTVVNGGSTTLLAKAASGCYLDLDVLKNGEEVNKDDSIQTIEDTNCQGL